MKNVNHYEKDGKLFTGKTLEHYCIMVRLMSQPRRKLELNGEALNRLESGDD